MEEGKQQAITEDARINNMKRLRRRWCIAAWITGIISLTLVLFGIIWSTTHKKYADNANNANNPSNPNNPNNPNNPSNPNSPGNPSSPSKINHESPYANLTKLFAYNTASPLASKPRVFVVGDVHGCIDEFNALLDAIDYTESTDQVIIAGDLTAGGPDSLGVIRRAKEIGALCVRGNHDDKVIRFRTYMNANGGLLPARGTMNEGAVPDPLKFGNKHAAIATNMTDEDYEYLQSCPLILDLQPFNAYVVHAGLDPTVKIDDQDPYSVLNTRDVNAAGILIPSDKVGDPWSNKWNAAQTNGSAKYVYYGHAAGRGLNLQQYTYGLDTGCVYGKQLTAMELHSHNLTQVNCTLYK